MKKPVLLFTTLLISFVSPSVLADEGLVTKEEFIKQLGGESPVRTRSIEVEGTRKIVVEPKKLTIKMNFKFDSTELAGERSHLQLAEAGNALSSDALAHVKLEIAGHTDSIGSSEYNLRLSQRRAEKIKNDLIRFYAISPSRLVAQGYGEDGPITSNYTETGRAENRRVVIERLK